MELTLEALAARLAVVEKKLAERQNTPLPRKKDWRRVVGMFTDSELMRQIDTEGQAIREAERNAAQEGQPE
ncbi:MAG: hypothetical protein C0467_31745 [Planctomycetaceae bacterium]|nr:hypothetical protein [Planctomycetaceae bacterium]